MLDNKLKQLKDVLNQKQLSAEKKHNAFINGEINGYIPASSYNQNIKEELCHLIRQLTESSCVEDVVKINENFNVFKLCVYKYNIGMFRINYNKIKKMSIKKILNLFLSCKNTLCEADKNYYSFLFVK